MTLLNDARQNVKATEFPSLRRNRLSCSMMIWPQTLYRNGPADSGRKMKQATQRVIFEFLDNVAPVVSHNFRIYNAINLGHGEPELKIVNGFVDPERDAIDIGAHRGIYSQVLAQKAKKVHAFEPHPILYRYLKHVMPSTVEVHNLAASNTVGELAFHIPRGGGYFGLGQGTLEQPTYFDPDNKVVTRYVRTVVLDDVLSEPVGFIKIDVEGHEPSVIRGHTGSFPPTNPTFWWKLWSVTASPKWTRSAAC